MQKHGKEWSQLSTVTPTSLASLNPATNQGVNNRAKVKAAQKYSPKPLGTGHTLKEGRDCHHTQEKPKSLRAPTPASQPHPLPLIGY